MPRASTLRTAVALGVLGGIVGQPLWAQTDHFNAGLIPAVRQAASLIPGQAPTGVHFVLLNPFKIALATLVEGATSDTVDAAYPVFQIRFPSGWIVVDAALDRTFVPNSRTFSDDVYQQIHQALRGANLAVVTHEHHDHVAGVLTSPFLDAIQPHTLLTKAQVGSLMTRPNNPRIKIDSAFAARYLVIDYDPFLPVAPGVVLIRAPGHTPGSQLVYVRLASGGELIIAGDVAWHMSGIETQRQKPESATRSFGGEDRAAIARELHWLHEVAESRIEVLVSHDVKRLNTLLAQGRLISGFDLRPR